MHKQDLKQFKNAFMRENLLKYIQKDFELIMVWLAGSTLTGLADDKSDYDLGILIADTPANTRNDRNEDYLIYKPTGKRVQWIYDQVSDITTAQYSANQRNIGWAQFGCLTDINDEHILYINPKYHKFIEHLFQQKTEIAKYSIWLYLQTKDRYVNELLTRVEIPKELQLKSLYHFCWAASILSKQELNAETVEFIKRVKRSDECTLSKEDCYEALKRLHVVVDYYKTNPSSPPQIEPLEILHEEE